MSAPPKPTDIEDAVTQLWYVVIGLNGDGLRSQVTRILEILEAQREAEIATKAAASATKAAAITATSTRERRKVSAREWVLIGATAIPTMILCYLTWLTLSHPAVVQAVAKVAQ